MRLPLSTEDVARFSARRPWLVIGFWAAALLASAVAILALWGGALTNEIAFTNNPESRRAEKLLEQLRGPEKASEVVIVRSPDLTVDDPEFRPFVERLYGDLMALSPGVIEGGTNFYQSGDPSLVSADRHMTILPFTIAGLRDDAQDKIGPVLDVVNNADGADRFDVLISGYASVNAAFSDVAEKDLQRGEVFGVPIALVVLVIVFGALVAAFVPLALAGFSIVLALGVIAVAGQLAPFSFFVSNIITMMGLAVGIDYSLFIISRYREERVRGLDRIDSISAAGATASQAVFFSGITVVLALLGMLLVPSTIFRSLAGGAIVVVLMSVFVSLTLLPAILGLLGDKVNALRLPFLGATGRGNADAVHPGDGSRRSGFWYSATRVVMRYPVVSLVAASALLIALAVPYAGIKTGSAGVSTLPDGLQVKEGFEILEREFSFGLVTPAEIAIQGDAESAGVQEAIGRLEETLKGNERFGKATLEMNESGDLGVLSVPVNGDPTGDEVVADVRALRDEYVPQAFAGAGARTFVGGLTSMNIDYFDQTSGSTPIVFVFVLGLSFVLLTLVFRSLVVPIKAIIMNLLSVGASYGVLVLVFQEGVGNEILGFQQVTVIEAWVPLWTFSILFGLSMDYHVFLLSRIRERFTHTGDNSESVTFGVGSTAGIITGAALIMASVFGGVALGDLVMFQQMGFGLAVAVMLDATIVRSILVPAAMQLLGDKNWWLPHVLRWLPRLQTEASTRSREGAEAS